MTYGTLSSVFGQIFFMKVVMGHPRSPVHCKPSGAGPFGIKLLISPLSQVINDYNCYKAWKDTAWAASKSGHGTFANGYLF